jgi:hypothetical protein
MLVSLSQVLPITGALVNVGLALAVFALGEVARGWASTSKLAAKLLAKPLAFEAYYRTHPPRSFAYYVFYPLLFPYWLANREARREFLLFKGYTILSLGLLVVGSIWQYFTRWLPELGVRQFLPVFGATLVLEALVVLAMMMPIATTIVHFHVTARRRRLVALLLVGLASTTFAIVRTYRKRTSTVSMSTRERIRLRTQVAPARARFVREEALRAAWKIVASTTADVEGDGLVEGDALEAAHAALGPFYKDDEAYAFQLWASPRKKPREVVLFFPTERKKRELVWSAMDSRGGVLAKSPTREQIDKMIAAAAK